MSGVHGFSPADPPPPPTRAEFEALTFKVDAMLDILLKAHPRCYLPGLDLPEVVQCKACEAIHDLESELGLS